MHPDYKLIAFTNDQITPELSDQIGDTNAAIWCPKPYKTFAFDVRYPDVSIPPWLLPEDVALPEKEEYSLEELESVPLEDTPFLRWVDRKLSRKVMADRFTDPGYLILILHKRSGEIAGILHARTATLRRLWETEEWANSWLMSWLEFTPCPEEEARFFQRAQFHLDLHPEDQLLTVSLQYLAPALRGTDAFHAMHRKLAEMIDPEHALLPLMAEIPDEGVAHILGRAIAERYIYEMLPNGRGVIFARNAVSCLAYFKLDRDVFRERVKRVNAQLEAIYVPSSTDNPKVEVRTASDGKGLGVFATEKIEPGVLITEFTGETYIADGGAATSLPSVMRDHAVQVSSNMYVFGESGIAQLINHSCRPVAGIRGTTQIVSVETIQNGQEITWDYRCTEDSDWVLPECRCGAAECSGIVKGFSSLPLTKQREYLMRGMVSEWIRKRFVHLLR